MRSMVHESDKFLGATCARCGLDLPKVPSASPGEFIGITQFGTPYRIGKHNQDAMCDGTPASAFHQDSQ